MKYAVKPVTRTTRSGYSSGFLCAARMVSRVHNVYVDERPAALQMSAQQGDYLIHPSRFGRDAGVKLHLEGAGVAHAALRGDNRLAERRHRLRWARNPAWGWRHG